MCVCLFVLVVLENPGLGAGQACMLPLTYTLGPTFNILRTFSKVASPCYNPPAVCEVSSFFTSLPILTFVLFIFAIVEGMRPYPMAFTLFP